MSKIGKPGDAIFNPLKAPKTSVSKPKYEIQEKGKATPIGDKFLRDADKLGPDITKKKMTGLESPVANRVNSQQPPRSEVREIRELRDAGYQKIRTSAEKRDTFFEVLDQAFGAGTYSVQTADILRDRILRNDHSIFPNVQLVSGPEIQDANAAYSVELQSILLNKDLIDGAKASNRAVATYLEEFGHHLDLILKGPNADSIGDEGEIFRRLLMGEPLSESQLRSIRKQDDRGTLDIDGVGRRVEFDDSNTKLSIPGTEHAFDLRLAFATGQSETFPDGQLKSLSLMNASAQGLVVSFPKEKGLPITVQFTSPRDGVGWNAPLTGTLDLNDCGLLKGLLVGLQEQPGTDESKALYAQAIDALALPDRPSPAETKVLRVHPSEFSFHDTPINFRLDRMKPVSVPDDFGLSPEQPIEVIGLSRIGNWSLGSRWEDTITIDLSGQGPNGQPTISMWEQGIEEHPIDEKLQEILVYWLEEGSMNARLSSEEQLYLRRAKESLEVIKIQRSPGPSQSSLELVTDSNQTVDFPKNVDPIMKIGQGDVEIDLSTCEPDDWGGINYWGPRASDGNASHNGFTIKDAKGSMLTFAFPKASGPENALTDGFKRGPFGVGYFSEGRNPTTAYGVRDTPSAFSYLTGEQVTALKAWFECASNRGFSDVYGWDKIGAGLTKLQELADANELVTRPISTPENYPQFALNIEGTSFHPLDAVVAFDTQKLSLGDEAPTICLTLEKEDGSMLFIQTPSKDELDDSLIGKHVRPLNIIYYDPKQHGSFQDGVARSITADDVGKLRQWFDHRSTDYLQTLPLDHPANDSIKSLESLVQNDSLKNNVELSSSSRELERLPYTNQELQSRLDAVLKDTVLLKDVAMLRRLLTNLSIWGQERENFTNPQRAAIVADFYKELYLLTKELCDENPGLERDFVSAAFQSAGVGPRFRQLISLFGEQPSADSPFRDLFSLAMGDAVSASSSTSAPSTEVDSYVTQILQAESMPDYVPESRTASITVRPSGSNGHWVHGDFSLRYPVNARNVDMKVSYKRLRSGGGGTLPFPGSSTWVNIQHTGTHLSGSEVVVGARLHNQVHDQHQWASLTASYEVPNQKKQGQLEEAERALIQLTTKSLDAGNRVGLEALTKHILNKHRDNRSPDIIMQAQAIRDRAEILFANRTESEEAYKLGHLGIHGLNSPTAKLTKLEAGWPAESQSGQGSVNLDDYNSRTHEAKIVVEDSLGTTVTIIIPPRASGRPPQIESFGEASSRVSVLNEPSKISEDVGYFLRTALRRKASALTNQSEKIFIESVCRRFLSTELSRDESVADDLILKFDEIDFSANQFKITGATQLGFDLASKKHQDATKDEGLPMRDAVMRKMPSIRRTDFPYRDALKECTLASEENNQNLTLRFPEVNQIPYSIESSVDGQAFKSLEMSDVKELMRFAHASMYDKNLSVQEVQLCQKIIERCVQVHTAQLSEITDRDAWLENAGNLVDLCLNHGGYAAEVEPGQSFMDKAFAFQNELPGFKERFTDLRKGLMDDVMRFPPVSIEDPRLGLINKYGSFGYTNEFGETILDVLKLSPYQAVYEDLKLSYAEKVWHSLNVGNPVDGMGEFLEHYHGRNFYGPARHDRSSVLEEAEKSLLKGEMSESSFEKLKERILSRSRFIQPNSFFPSMDAQSFLRDFVIYGDLDDKAAPEAPAQGLGMMGLPPLGGFYSMQPQPLASWPIRLVADSERLPFWTLNCGGGQSVDSGAMTEALAENQPLNSYPLSSVIFESLTVHPDEPNAKRFGERKKRILNGITASILNHLTENTVSEPDVLGASAGPVGLMDMHNGLKPNLKLEDLLHYSLFNPSSSRQIIDQLNARTENQDYATQLQTRLQMKIPESTFHFGFDACEFVEADYGVDSEGERFTKSFVLRDSEGSCLRVVLAAPGSSAVPYMEYSNEKLGVLEDHPIRFPISTYRSSFLSLKLQGLLNTESQPSAFDDLNSAYDSLKTMILDQSVARIDRFEKARERFDSLETPPELVFPGATDAFSLTRVDMQKTFATWLEGGILQVNFTDYDGSLLSIYMPPFGSEEPLRYRFVEKSQFTNVRNGRLLEQPSSRDAVVYGDITPEMRSLLTLLMVNAMERNDGRDPKSYRALVAAESRINPMPMLYTSGSIQESSIGHVSFSSDNPGELDFGHPDYKLNLNRCTFEKSEFADGKWQSVIFRDPEANKFLRFRFGGAKVFPRMECLADSAELVFSDRPPMWSHISPAIARQMSDYYFETVKPRIDKGEAGSEEKQAWQGVMKLLRPMLTTQLLENPSWPEIEQWMARGMIGLDGRLNDKSILDVAQAKVKSSQWPQERYDKLHALLKAQCTEEFSQNDFRLLREFREHGDGAWKDAEGQPILFGSGGLERVKALMDTGAAQLKPDDFHQLSGEFSEVAYQRLLELDNALLPLVDDYMLWDHQVNDDDNIMAAVFGEVKEETYDSLCKSLKRRVVRDLYKDDTDYLDEFLDTGFHEGKFAYQHIADLGAPSLLAKVDDFVTQDLRDMLKPGEAGLHYIYLGNGKTRVITRTLVEIPKYRRVDAGVAVPANATVLEKKISGVTYGAERQAPLSESHIGLWATVENNTAFAKTAIIETIYDTQLAPMASSKDYTMVEKGKLSQVDKVRMEREFRNRAIDFCGGEEHVDWSKSTVLIREEVLESDHADGNLSSNDSASSSSGASQIVRVADGKIYSNPMTTAVERIASGDKSDELSGLYARKITGRTPASAENESERKSAAAQLDAKDGVLRWVEAALKRTWKKMNPYSAYYDGVRKGNELIENDKRRAEDELTHWKRQDKYLQIDEKAAEKLADNPNATMDDYKDMAKAMRENKKEMVNEYRSVQAAKREKLSGHLAGYPLGSEYMERRERYEAINSKLVGRMREKEKEEKNDKAICEFFGGAWSYGRCKDKSTDEDGAVTDYVDNNDVDVKKSTSEQKENDVDLTPRVHVPNQNGGGRRGRDPAGKRSPGRSPDNSSKDDSDELPPIGIGEHDDGDTLGVNSAPWVSNASRQSNSSSSSSSSGDGSSCCFIFLEARYGDGTLDEVVRRYRDEHMTVKNRRGYYRLSEVLVPLMRQYPIMKVAVRITLTDPLVSYGRYHYGDGRLGWLFKPVRNFWMRVFDVVGGDTKFIRENGEVV